MLGWSDEVPENIARPTLKEFIENYQYIEILNDYIPTNTFVNGYGIVTANGIREKFIIPKQQVKLAGYGMPVSTLVYATNFTEEP
jgi:hypothetical protein